MKIENIEEANRQILTVLYGAADAGAPVLLHESIKPLDEDVAKGLRTRVMTVYAGKLVLRSFSRNLAGSCPAWWQELVSKLMSELGFALLEFLSVVKRGASIIFALGEEAFFWVADLLIRLFGGGASTSTGWKAWFKILKGKTTKRDLIRPLYDAATFRRLSKTIDDARSLAVTDIGGFGGNVRMLPQRGTRKRAAAEDHRVIPEPRAQREIEKRSRVKAQSRN